MTSLWPVAARLGNRFSSGGGCVVPARGMISAATIAGLEERKKRIYPRRTRALERRRRAQDRARERRVAALPLLVERKAGETQLFVKQVKAEGVRYVVCRNEAEAENDRKVVKRSSPRSMRN